MSIYQTDDLRRAVARASGSCSGGLLVSTRVGHDNEVLPQVRYWIPHLSIVHPERLRVRMVAELAAYVERSADPHEAARPMRIN